VKLKPYLDYKDSGLPWLGKIPVHWALMRSGFLFREVVDTGHPNLDLLSIDRFRGIIHQVETGRKARASEDRSGYKRIHTGDLGYNLMNAFMGSIAISPYEGILSPAYAVARPRVAMNPLYYHYLYRTPIYTAEFDSRSYGIMYERNRLYYDRFKTIVAPYPPLDEQQQIVALIRQQESRILQLIRAKRRLIDLLNEQKQVIIQRAVTHGLDPTVCFKPSGIDWLGDVPEHWDVRTLKQVAIVRLSGVDKHTVEGERPIQLCNYTDVYNRDFISSDIEFMPASATNAEIAALALRAGDVLMPKDSEMWDDIAVPALVTENLDGVLCGYHLALIRPALSRLVGEFLFHALSTPVLAQQFHVAANGVTRYGLSKHAIKNAVIPLPPVPEQEAICRQIVDHLKPITASMERVQKEIDLIREYRTRLIADVVTGKRDVRGMELPALDEAATLDDFDDDEVAELAEETSEVETIAEENGH
jgi:type I restriction enzyme S subunit